MKKLFSILLVLCMLLSLVACTVEPADGPSNGTSEPKSESDPNPGESSSLPESESKPSESESQSKETETTVPAPTWTGVLYADFSNGSTDTTIELIKEYPFEYTGNKKTAEELADELSKLTGLDFFITSKKVSDGISVDWALNSTLVKGLDDRVQKEDFFFHEFITLCWFMMDSLWRTLKDNLDVEKIYYTMDGGKELNLSEMLPVKVFPINEPYLGSVHYFDEYGKEEEVFDFSATKGLWLKDGKSDGPCIEMDGLGGFTSYFADGSIDTIGYLKGFDEYGDGSIRYDMFTMENVFINGFYFDSETQIHIGNLGDEIYILASENSGTTQTGVLYADFSYGRGPNDPDSVKEYPFEYSGEPKTAEELADELSKLTGLDFFITVKAVNDGIVVDWAANSTLIAGPDDRLQKDEFFFFDAVTLNWFMMDSLYLTLMDNLSIDNVYYTMSGGKTLEFVELLPIRIFPSDVPYMGYPYYREHADNQGDNSGGIYAKTEGIWYLGGKTDAAKIEMDGFGGFTTYYATGTVESTGYIKTVDEFGDGNLRYDMYTMDNVFISGFYFDNDNQFHIGNNADAVYVKGGVAG